MSTQKYILNKSGKPVKCNDLRKWSEWYQTSKQRVTAETTIGRVRVSTVFLGLDHNWSDTGKPILWETMVFGGCHDQYQRRYSSKSLALLGHKAMVALVKDSIAVNRKPVKRKKAHK